MLGTSIIFLTGIRISQVIFPSGSNGNSAFLVSIHKFSSYFCLVLIAIHLFLHRSYIWAFMRSVFAQREIKTALTLVTGIIIGTLCTKTLLGSDKQLPYTSTPPSVSSRSPANPPGNDDSGNPILQDTQAYGQTMSLSDFLGNMFCTGCSKHCSLLNLRCDRGNAQLQAAKIEYQNLYGQIPADSTTDPTQENSQNFEIPPQNGEEMYSKGAQHRNKGSHGSAHRFF
ncbi:DUF4405 domain-containing protein [Desulfosporosinus orientis]|uniref:DUF4405 domain-containing protein n=1 Tax=Desulfosporosinus orientis TaxID=1563 RepID=UPI001FA78534|nr:DUF4405 domain-containing protein [Desulfosporosinus orientis]